MRMLYYKVKPEYDNKPILKRVGKHLEYAGCLIANELYTLREVNNKDILMYMLEPVEIPRGRVYFSFGARFAL